MSYSGSGRGRGWLNLSKNNPPKPGQTPVTQMSSNQLPDATQTNEYENSEYADLINGIKQLNMNDDGIMLNRKLEYIIEQWTKQCSSEEDAWKSFEVIYQASLQNTELASKLVLMVTPYNFQKQEIGGVSVRKLFLTKLQESCEEPEELFTTNRGFYRNSLIMLSEYFNKHHVINSGYMIYLAGPLISNLSQILESKNAIDLKLFTMKFLSNGPLLKKQCPKKLHELLIKIRMTLTNDYLGKEARLWLLLALDYSCNNFQQLPKEIQTFYEQNLEELPEENIQLSPTMPNALSIQTTNHMNKELEGFHSNVNVLQVSKSSDVVKSSVNANTSTAVRGPSNNSEKPGRPILGAGAGLKKNNSQELRKNWKDNSAGWNSKQKNTLGSGWNGKHDVQVKSGSNKGWEHDDRFDNDYN